MEQTALQQLKDEVAKELGFPDWNNYFIEHRPYDIVAQRYASQQCAALKEELERVNNLLAVNERIRNRMSDSAGLMAEIKQLKEENERLREALKAVLSWSAHIPSAANEEILKAYDALNPKTS